jgi:hypothetical protein
LSVLSKAGPGLRLLRKLAARDNVVALEILGERLIEGRGVPKDAQRGRRMLARIERLEKEREGDWSWG